MGTGLKLRENGNGILAKVKINRKTAHSTDLNTVWGRGYFTDSDTHAAYAVSALLSLNVTEDEAFT